MNNNLQYYFDTLTTAHYIGDLEGELDGNQDGEVSISIPFRMSSEQRGTDNFMKNTKEAIYSSIEYKSHVKHIIVLRGIFIMVPPRLFSPGFLPFSWFADLRLFLYSTPSVRAYRQQILVTI